MNWEPLAEVDSRAADHLSGGPRNLCRLAGRLAAGLAGQFTDCRASLYREVDGEPPARIGNWPVPELLFDHVIATGASHFGAGKPVPVADPCFGDGWSGSCICAELRTERGRFGMALLQADDPAALQATDLTRLSPWLTSVGICLDQAAQLEETAGLITLGTLTAGIVHEIKNPLNLVSSFAELTFDLADEAREELAQLRLADDRGLSEIITDVISNAKKLRHHAQRIDHIVHSIMLHARGDAYVTERCPFNELVAEHVKLGYYGWRARHDETEVSIELALDDAVPWLKLAPVAFGRVVINLIVNACDAILGRWRRREPDYVPALLVTSRCRPDSIVLTIRDNGVGISAAAQARVFEPFYTTKAAAAGTGLGLAICREIINEQHGGSLTLTSAADEFTEFKIVLPRQSSRGEADGKDGN